MKSAKTAKKKAKKTVTKPNPKKKSIEAKSEKKKKAKSKKKAKRRSSSADLGCSYVAVGKASRPKKTLNGKAIVPSNAA